jgi:leader peptidase (prepilin peptidase) / N-methyltransferase
MAELVIATGVLTALLIAASVIDIRTMRIPDPLNATLAATGLAASWLLQRDLVTAVLGIAIGYGAIAVLNFAYFRLRGRDGIGMGDAKLLGGLGAWLGWTGLPFVALAGSICGLAVFAALALFRGRSLAAALPFGPFLSAGGLLVWFAQVWLDADYLA